MKTNPQIEGTKTRNKTYFISKIKTSNNESKAIESCFLDPKKYLNLNDEMIIGTTIQ